VRVPYPALIYSARQQLPHVDSGNKGGNLGRDTHA
jgi:hypothetical protein